MCGRPAGRGPRHTGIRGHVDDMVMLKRIVLVIAAAVALPWVFTPVGLSTNEKEYEIDLAHTIEVQLGSKTNQMVFFPGRITLNKGERYLLVLTNPSPVTHEFASETFMNHIETERVKVLDKQGDLAAYVAGSITEVELLPGNRIEWEFVTTSAGSNIDLFCDIPGHKDAGMVGGITIK
jgi:uncharacterized cupredoxin-like copper-binding protein